MQLTVTTLIHQVVADLLFQNRFPMAHLPELVDLATVACGLGIPLSNYSFVEKNTPDWDFTQWSHRRHGFLIQRALSYSSALAAWVRGEQRPEWAKYLRPDIRHPMNKSLKYLLRTKDSFFGPETVDFKLLDQPQTSWIRIAQEKSASRQIVAIRHMKYEKRLAEEQEQLLLGKLRSSNEFIVQNAIWTIERMEAEEVPQSIVEELRGLMDHSSDEVRSKTAVVLTVLQEIDDRTRDLMTDMVGSNVWFVVHAGVFGLSSLESVPDSVLRPMNKGFRKALQNCDYGVLPHFANAFDRWLDDPEAYFKMLFEEDSPELLGVAMDTLNQVRTALTQLESESVRS